MNPAMAMETLPYVYAFLGAFGLTYALTPLVREMNRRFGMVDMPGERRVNKTPVPRGGGLALIAGVLASYMAFAHFADPRALDVPGLPGSTFAKFCVLSSGIGLLGYADDKFSLKPSVKLAGQLLVAALAWFWAGLGFHRLFASIPWWLDLPLTVFWIVGAVNAFNLIDGLDGLASGLALIATLGMAGSLFLLSTPHVTFFHFAMAGGLVAFLRFNFNPASVFLGDCGSMFIGFTMATLPLVHQAADSFVVSIGVPLLAMGVPIFDTALAILRRTLRRFIGRREASGSSAAGEVMTADSDHVHHRILRSVGFNQRKAAVILYAAAAAAVLTGLCAAAMKSRAAGLWLAAFAVAVVLSFRDMALVELFDAGRLITGIVRAPRTRERRLAAKFSVPLQIVFDAAALSAVFVFCAWAFRIRMDYRSFRVALLLRVVPVFVALALFRTYRTVWARAMVSNYMRLAAACALGTAAGSVATYYAPVAGMKLKATTAAYAPLAFTVLAFARASRNVLRDYFYSVDCARMKTRGDVERVLVYGSGLRYRAFRRELVRSAFANTRMIVALVDDDVLLKGRYIGGIRILGPFDEIENIVSRRRVDSLVVAFETDAARLGEIRSRCAKLGVKVSCFALSETPAPAPDAGAAG